MYWLCMQSQFRLVLVSVLPDDCTSQGALQTVLVIFVSFSVALTSVLQMAIHQLVVLFEFQKKDERKYSYFTFFEFHPTTGFMSKVKPGQTSENSE